MTVNTKGLVVYDANLTSPLNLNRVSSANLGSPLVYDLTDDGYWQNYSGTSYFGSTTNGTYSWDDSCWVNVEEASDSKFGLEVNGDWNQDFRADKMRLYLNSGSDAGNFGSLTNITVVLIDVNDNVVGKSTGNAFTAYNQGLIVDVPIDNLRNNDYDRIEIYSDLLTAGPKVCKIEFFVNPYNIGVYGTPGDSANAIYIYTDNTYWENYTGSWYSIGLGPSNGNYTWNSTQWETNATSSTEWYFSLQAIGSWNAGFRATSVEITIGSGADEGQFGFLTGMDVYFFDVLGGYLGYQVDQNFSSYNQDIIVTIPIDNTDNQDYHRFEIESFLYTSGPIIKKIQFKGVYAT